MYIHVYTCTAAVGVNDSILHAHKYYFRFQPSQDDPKSRNSRGISPYAEFHQLVGDRVPNSPPDVVGVPQMRPPLPPKAYLRSTSEGRVSRENYDFLSGPVDSYDYLRPSERGSRGSHSPQPTSRRRDGTPPQTTLSDSPQKVNLSSSVDHLCPSRSGFKHRRIYEQLSPRDGEDGDTYVYMAPLKDFPESAKQEQAAQLATASTSTTSTSAVEGSGSTAVLDSSSELRLVLYTTVSYISVMHFVVDNLRLITGCFLRCMWLIDRISVTLPPCVLCVCVHISKACLAKTLYFNVVLPLPPPSPIGIVHSSQSSYM